MSDETPAGPPSSTGQLLALAIIILIGVGLLVWALFAGMG
jgi:hypothetical protein